jgi:hypothetical protein
MLTVTDREGDSPTAGPTAGRAIAKGAVLRVGARFTRRVASTSISASAASRGEGADSTGSELSTVGEEAAHGSKRFRVFAAFS